MRALEPATAVTSPAVAVATPLSRQRKFSATRSALRRPRAGPDIRASVSPGRTCAVPPNEFEDEVRLHQLERELRHVETGDHPVVPGNERRGCRRVRRDDGVRRQVAGAPEVLDQRGANKGLIKDFREGDG